MKINFTLHSLYRIEVLSRGKYKYKFVQTDRESGPHRWKIGKIVSAIPEHTHTHTHTNTYIQPNSGALQLVEIRVADESFAT